MPSAATPSRRRSPEPPRGRRARSAESGRRRDAGGWVEISGARGRHVRKTGGERGRICSPELPSPLNHCSGGVCAAQRRGRGALCGSAAASPTTMAITRRSAAPFLTHLSDPPRCRPSGGGSTGLAELGLGGLNGCAKGWIYRMDTYGGHAVKAVAQREPQPAGPGSQQTFQRSRPP